jgi:hypothetical protein
MEEQTCYETLAVLLFRQECRFICCREWDLCRSEIGDKLLAVTDRNSANLFCEKEKIQKFAFLRSNKQLMTIKVG